MATEITPDMWTPYRPLWDNVILTPVVYEKERVVNGIVLLEANSENAQVTEGYVCAVGPGVGLHLSSAQMERLVTAISGATYGPIDQEVSAGKPYHLNSVIGLQLKAVIEDALGPTPSTLKVGDRVLFQSWICNWQKHYETGQLWATCRADQILGVVDGTPPLGVRPL